MVNNFYLYFLNDLSYIPRPSKWIEFIMEKQLFSLLKTTLEYIRLTHVMANHILLTLFYRSDASTKSTI
jgi:hypothetical protein